MLTFFLWSVIIKSQKCSFITIIFPPKTSMGVDRNLLAQKFYYWFPKTNLFEEAHLSAETKQLWVLSLDGTVVLSLSQSSGNISKDSMERKWKPEEGRRGVKCWSLDVKWPLCTGTHSCGGYLHKICTKSTHLQIPGWRREGYPKASSRAEKLLAADGY